MMIKPSFFIKISSIFLAFACILYAPESQAASAGTSSGMLLLTADTARMNAMNQAGGTMTGDPGVVFYNPAGLHDLKQISSLFTHQTGLALDHTEILNIVFPVQGIGGFGASFVYHGMEMLDDAGAGVAGINVSGKLAILSFGRLEPELLPGFAYGINLKLLNSVLGEYSANSFSADVGFQYQPLPEVMTGLSIKNMGTGLKYIDEEDSLPLRAILSGKYHLLQQDQKNLYIALDIEQTLEMDTYIHVGSEFSYAQTLFLRAGYTFAPEGTNGISFGLGVQTKVAGYVWHLDYAYRMNAWSDENYDGTQLVSLGIDI
ncbi:PorV/PorQ family protein [bacterium]|nr:PorV/PorQ family protein [bacterium]